MNKQAGTYNTIDMALDYWVNAQAELCFETDDHPPETPQDALFAAARLLNTPGVTCTPSSEAKSINSLDCDACEPWATYFGGAGALKRVCRNGMTMDALPVYWETASVLFDILRARSKDDGYDSIADALNARGNRYVVSAIEEAIRVFDRRDMPDDDRRELGLRLKKLAQGQKKPEVKDDLERASAYLMKGLRPMDELDIERHSLTMQTSLAAPPVPGLGFKIEDDSPI